RPSRRPRRRRRRRSSRPAASPFPARAQARDTGSAINQRPSLHGEPDMTEPTIEPITPPSAAPAPTAAPAMETGTLTLAPPAAVGAVAPAQAEAAVQLDPADVAKLDAMADQYVAQITAMDVHEPAFAAKADDLRKLGDAEIQDSANVSRRLLDKPVAAMEHGGLTPASDVSKSLVQLRRTVEDLDPAHQGDLLS